MRRWKHYIIGLAMLVLAACTKAPELAERPAPALLKIDSLLWQRPDSALALLLPYFDTCSDAMLVSPKTPNVDSSETHSMRLYDRHYANLLLAELLYKNDYAQANRTALQQAVAYFDSLADTPDAAFLAARAHYINGVGYYEQDSAVQACKEYILALEIMEEYFDEKELVGEKARFVAFTYTHLAGLFSDQYLHEQAIYFGNRALDYYHRYKATPWHIAWMYNEIGSNYHMLCDFNKADSLYDLAINVLPDTNNLIYRDIVVLKAFLLYNKVKQAKMSLQQLKSLLLLSESEKEYLARCAIIGEIFYCEKEFDSAWIYLDRVYQGKSNTDSKKQATEWLLEICKIQGRDSEVSEYANFLAPFATINENQGTMKSQLAELYNYYKQKEKEQQHNQRARKQTKDLVVVIAGLMAAILCLFILYYRNKRKKKNIELQLKTERYAHEMKQKALSGRLKESNQELRELKDRIQIQETPPKSEKRADSFMDEPVCRLIMERVREGQFKSKMDCKVYEQYALDKQQLMDLRVAADRHYSQFTLRLRKAYPQLTNIDIDHCCLYLLNLTHAEVSALTQHRCRTRQQNP